MPRKLLSIITVTKNCVLTIERTLNSVRNVKSDYVEYIIVDGISDDGTLDTLKKHSDLIDHFICEPDTGIYQAMNKGVAKSTGEFVLFINGDDEIIPGGVQNVLKILPACTEQIVCATTTVVGDGHHPGFQYIPDPPKLVYWDSIPHPSSFIKRELLIRYPFREDFKMASDYDFFLKVFLAGISFKVVPYQTALHYYGGITSDKDRLRKEVNILLKENLGWWQAVYRQTLLWLWRRIKRIKG